MPAHNRRWQSRSLWISGARIQKRHNPIDLQAAYAGTPDIIVAIAPGLNEQEEQHKHRVEEEDHLPAKRCPKGKRDQATRGDHSPVGRMVQTHAPGIRPLDFAPIEVRDYSGLHPGDSSRRTLRFITCAGSTLTRSPVYIHISVSPSPATDWSSLLLTYPAAPSPTHRGNKSGQLWKSSVVPCGSGRPTQHHDGRAQIQTTHLSLPTTSPPCCPARAYSEPQAILGPLPRRSAHRSRHPLICHDAQPCPSPCDRRQISANDRFSLQQCPQAQQPVPGDET